MKTNTAETDLLVIGGGALGAFHAFAGLQRGLSVTLLERNTAPQEATVRNFGQVVPSGLTQHWQKFGRESLSIYNRIQDEGDISVRKNGSVYLASDDDEIALIEELQAINADNDYRSELWTPQQCRDRYPTLRSDYCRGGLFFPEEISVNPRTMIHRFHRYLSQHENYQSHFQACVTDLESTGGSVIATTADGHRFRAAKAILCSGSEFRLLFPDVFRASDLESVKLQMLRLAPQKNVRIPGNLLTGLSIRRYESFSECPSWEEIHSRESDDSFWKTWGIHILFKQETDGGIILGDSHEYASVAEIDQLGFDLRNDVNHYFLHEGQKIFDLPCWNIESSWFGVYCQTKHPSGIFTKTIEDNIHIVTGIGGKGMTSSAGFAKHYLGEMIHD